MRENWYVLEDGRTVDPSEVAPDDSGVLRHKSGVAVARHASGLAVVAPVDDPDGRRGTVKDVKPEKPKGGYKTREAKAE